MPAHKQTLHPSIDPMSALARTRIQQHCSAVQIVVQAQTLVVIRVDRHFRDKGGRRKELHFYAPFGYEIISGREREQREEGRYGAHRRGEVR